MFFETKQFTINKDITSRDIHRFVYFIQGLSSSVYVIGDRTVNAESILGMLSLGLHKGSLITISLHNDISQKDINDDMDRIVSYLEGGMCGSKISLGTRKRTTKKNRLCLANRCYRCCDRNNDRAYQQ